MLRYKHPQLGRFEKLDIRKGGVATVLVSEKELEELTRYLNNRSAPGARRLLDVLHDMQELEKIDPPVWSEQIDGPMVVERAGRFQPNPVLKRIAPDKYRVQIEIDQLQASINAKLATYRFLPYVLSVYEGRWAVAWNLKRPGSQYAMDEAQALETILNLARAAHLNRLRRCLHCQRWLYAKFRHQTFCSMKCQQNQYARTEEFKAKRRLYMRRYYQNNFSRKRR